MRSARFLMKVAIFWGVGFSLSPAADIPTFEQVTVEASQAVEAMATYREKNFRGTSPLENIARTMFKNACTKLAEAKANLGDYDGAKALLRHVRAEPLYGELLVTSMQLEATGSLAPFPPELPDNLLAQYCGGLSRILAKQKQTSAALKILERIPEGDNKHLEYVKTYAAVADLLFADGQDGDAMAKLNLATEHLAKIKDLETRVQALTCFVESLLHFLAAPVVLEPLLDNFEKPLESAKNAGPGLLANAWTQCGRFRACTENDEATKNCFAKVEALYREFGARVTKTPWEKSYMYFQMLESLSEGYLKTGRIEDTIKTLDKWKEAATGLKDPKWKAETLAALVRLNMKTKRWDEARTVLESVPDPTIQLPIIQDLVRTETRAKNDTALIFLANYAKALFPEEKNESFRASAISYAAQLFGEAKQLESASRCLAEVAEISNRQDQDLHPALAVQMVELRMYSQAYSLIQDIAEIRNRAMPLAFLAEALTKAQTPVAKGAVPKPVAE